MRGGEGWVGGGWGHCGGKHGDRALATECVVHTSNRPQDSRTPTLSTIAIRRTDVATTLSMPTLCAGHVEL